MIAAFGLLASCGGGAEPVAPGLQIEISREWVPGRGDRFMNVYSRQERTSAQMVEAAKQLLASGQFEEAMELLGSVRAFDRDPAGVQEALWTESAARRVRGDWQGAFDAMLAFIHRTPESARAARARKELFEIAKEAIEKGESRSFLIFGYSSSELGFELMQKALASFPQTDLSPGYAVWLADRLFKEERYNDVEKVCKFITTTYGRDQAETLASGYFLLGEVHLTRFNGLQYDVTPLKDADKQFHRILEEFPQTAVVEKARTRRAQIEEQLARKQIMAGDFYRSKGRPISAALYYSHVVREYPRSSGALEAQERLRALVPVPEPPPAAPPAPPPSPGNK